MTKHGATIYRKAWTAARDEYGSESAAYRVANAAVTRAGERVKNESFSRLVDSVNHPVDDTSPPTGCEFYRPDGFCRVTGGVCPQYESTFRQCEVRLGALSSPSRTQLALPSDEK